jgi:toxin secretion/phage lysis holin
MTHNNYFASGFGLLGGFLSWYLGDLDGAVRLLLVMAVIDQLSGLLKAAILKQWSSAIGFHGIARKIFMFMLVGIANITGREIFGGSSALRDTVAMFYIANEGISIIENAIDAKAPVPEGFKDWFLSWRSKKVIPKQSTEPK